MTCREKILQLLEFRGEIMTRDITEHAKKTVRGEIAQLRLEKRIYQCRWVPIGISARQTPVYALGSLPDVPMPVMTAEEAKERRKVLQRHKYQERKEKLREYRNQKTRERRAKAKEKEIISVSPGLEKVRRALKAGKELSVSDMSSIAGVSEGQAKIILKQLRTHVYIADYIHGKPQYSWKWNNEKNVEKPKNIRVPLSEIVSNWSFLYGAL